ncbi:MAG: hypothetical protein ACJ8F7_20845 [Gemmataceae bacterium]
MPDKPDHVPPHDRFFEEGEEPPERYDLEDELEYIVPREYEFSLAHCFLAAWKHIRRSRSRFLLYGIYYFFVLFTGLFMFTCIYVLLVDAPIRAGVLNVALGQLTGRPKRYGSFGFALRNCGPHLVCMLPAQLSCILVVYGVVGSVMLAQEVHEPYSWVGAIVVPALIVLHLFVSIRFCCFGPAFVRDHNLGAIQAIRASWLASRGHFWKLAGLKCSLWLIQCIAAVLTLGPGLIWAVPFTTLVWTAAYLEIAGSEPLINPNSIEIAQPAD